MIPKFIKSNPLYWAFFIPAAIDGIVTLLGQDTTYWSNYRSVNEGSPAWIILATHPALFILGSVIWFISWYFMYKKLKEPFNMMITIAFIAGHTWGSSSWISRFLGNADLYSNANRLGWYALVTYFIFLGVVCGSLINLHIKGLTKIDS